MRHAALIGALCVVCVTACSEETGPNIGGVPSLDIIRVDVSPSLDTLFVADTLRPTDRLQLKADVIGRLGSPIPSAAVAWASSKPEVATVTEGGLVIPTGYGSTVISASASSVGKATIVVMPAARSVVVTPGSDTIFVEDPIAARDSIRLTAKAIDENGQVVTGVAFTWSSAGTATATVNGAGSVLARSLGVVNITATSGTRVGTASVRVASMVKTVQVSSPVSTVLAKDTVQLTATALGYDDKPMGGRAFTWTSSSPAVATVDNNGRAIFLRAGSATFTAKSAFTTSAVTVNAMERQFQSIDAGTNTTCGYTNLGRGYCWGDGSLGKLASAADSSCFGEGTAGQSPCTLSPKRFAGAAIEFTAVSVDSTSGCGISKDKLIYCWGDNSKGQLGNGGKGAGAQPILATVGQVRFDSISVGGAHACALSTTRQAYCWGDDAAGQLGDRRRVISTTPIPVAGNLTFSSITAGRRHTCGISNSKVYCWGDNTDGQLGNGTSVGLSDVPVAVGTGNDFVALSAGAYHTCGLTANGSAVCWGRDFSGQSGVGSAGAIATSPAAVSSDTFVRISSAADHTCALTASGTILCWGGDADYGGVGTASPTVVPAGVTFRSVAAGDRHTCGIGTDGDVYCWGSDVYGSLGNELQASFMTTPQKVAAPR
jgi:alpha-tubulin suppressor-like RCC1 family protein